MTSFLSAEELDALGITEAKPFEAKAKGSFGSLQKKPAPAVATQGSPGRERLNSVPMDELPTEEEYSALQQRQREDSPSWPAEATIAQAQGEDRDTYLLAKKAEKAGIPFDLAVEDPDFAREHLQKAELSPGEIAERAPKTAEFLSVFEQAVIAAQDREELAKVENSFSRHVGAVNSGMLRLGTTVLSGYGRLTQIGGRYVEAGVEAISPSAADFLRGLDAKLAENVNLMPPGDALVELGRMGNSAIEENVFKATQNDSLSVEVVGAVGTLIGQVAATAANPSGALLIFGGMGLEEQASRQVESGAYGESLLSDAAVAFGAPITAATEKLGIDRLMDRIPPKIRNKFFRNVSDVLLGGAWESFQEVLETAMHSALELATTNDKAVLFENWDREALVAFLAGALFRGARNAVTGVPYEGTPSAIETGKADADDIRQIIDATQRMALTEDSPETMEVFLQTIGANDTDAFLDRNQVSKLVDDLAEDTSAEAVALREFLERKMEEAGEDQPVSMTGAELVTKIFTTKHAESFADSVVLSHDSVSQAESAAEEATLRQQMRDLIEDADADAEIRAQSDAIFESISGQLKATELYTAEEVRSMSAIVPAWAAAKAYREGKTPEQVYQEAGLTVVAEAFDGNMELQQGEVDATPQEAPVEQFVEALDSARGASSQGLALTPQTVESLEGARTFLGPNGEYGFAITADGELVSVFRHPDSEAKGVGVAMAKHALFEGAKHLNVFEGPVADIYREAGFEETGRSEFNEEHAPEGWDTETMGRPDYVEMVLRPEEKPAAEEAPKKETPKPPERGMKREADGSLGGLPRVRNASHFETAAKVAEEYMAGRKEEYNPPATYAEVDVARARRIAEAFEAMKHDPQNPEVAAAYEAMIEETKAQYREILKTGLVVEFVDFEKTGDPYAETPRMSTEDVRENNHLWVFSTRDGFGSSEDFNPVDNPLLAETEFTDANGQPMLANDVFRVVHDYFGHVKEGVGFRADGEENAWRAHAAMYSPLARRAMTTETRGQNSWVNFGPYGEKNRTAGPAETHFADQKIGLMPEWVSEEGRGDDAPGLEQRKSTVRGYYTPGPVTLFTKDSSHVRGFYTAMQRKISLTKKAEVSTFLHEFGHFMLDMEGVDSSTWKSVASWLAADPELFTKEASKYFGEAVTKKQVETFLGGHSTGDANLDGAMYRAFHEQFARAWETYLMEGKAPTEGLRGAFRNFATWLGRIYSVLRGRLDVTMNADIRAIFDSLLVADNMVEDAMTRNSLQPLFTDAAMAGMTEAQYQRYLNRTKEVKAKAAETVRDKIAKELALRLGREWRGRVNDKKEEIREDVAKERVHVARARIEGGMKIDSLAVRDLVGEEAVGPKGTEYQRIPARLVGLTKGGGEGIHPDHAAALLGYGSGHEMLLDLLESPTLNQDVQARAEAAVTEEHGEQLTPAALRKLADEAATTAVEAEGVLLELKALNATQNQKDLKAMRDMAKEKIAELKIRDLNPNTYRRAFVKAANEAAKAAAKGDMAKAAHHKKRQAAFMQLEMEARRVMAELGSRADWAKRFSKKKLMAEINKRGGGFASQISSVISRFKIGKVAEGFEVDNVEPFREWATTRLNDFAEGIPVSSLTMDGAEVDSAKDLTVSELRDVYHDLKVLEHVSRESGKVLRNKEDVAAEDTIKELVDSINSMPAGSKPPTLMEKESRWFKLKKHRNTWVANMTKIPWMARWMDNGEPVGIAHQLFTQPITDAYSESQKLLGATGVVVAKALQERSKETKDRHSRAVFVEELGINMPFRSVLAVALNVGNEQNLRRLIIGEGWGSTAEGNVNLNNRKLKGVLSHLKKEDMDLVQLIWDQMDLLYPRMVEVIERTTGDVPPRVEASPVQMPFGLYRGGYYPIKTDRERAQLDSLDESTSAMFDTSDIFTHVNVSTSAAHERSNSEHPLLLDVDVVTQHFREVVHFITHYEAVRSINRLIRDPRVKEAVSTRLSPEDFAELKPWLISVARDGRESNPGMMLDPIIRHMRLGVTWTVMGYKAATSAMQTLGLFNSAEEVGTINLLAGFKAVYGSPAEVAANLKWMDENSKIMSTRADTMDREMSGAVASLKSKRNAADTYRDLAFVPIAVVQRFAVDAPTWFGAVHKEMARSGDMDKAIQYADWVVENVQGSGRTATASRIMRSKSETTQALTTFMTFFSAFFNQSRNFKREVSAGRAGILGALSSALMLYVYPVIGEMLIRGEFPDEDDEEGEFLAKAMLKVALYPAATVPGVRDVASMAEGFNFQASPVLGALEDWGVAGKAIGSAFSDKGMSEYEAKKLFTTIGTITHLPGTAQLWTTGSALTDWLIEGEDTTLRALTLGEPYDKKK